MKSLDRWLQTWRVRKALCNLPAAGRVIDVGTHEGELFQALGGRLQTGFGIDPLLRACVESTAYTLHPGYFPEMRPPDGGWDAIVMLAVLEHIPRPEQAALVKACHDLLKVGGRVVITVPSGAVDRILSVLKFLRLIDGMSLEEHFGFEPAETLKLFSPPWFRLVRHERFQLGLNHLYVFAKEPGEGVP